MEVTTIINIYSPGKCIVLISILKTGNSGPEVPQNRPVTLGHQQHPRHQDKRRRRTFRVQRYRFTNGTAIGPFHHYRVSWEVPKRSLFTRQVLRPVHSQLSRVGTSREAGTAV